MDDEVAPAIRTPHNGGIKAYPSPSLIQAPRRTGSRVQVNRDSGSATTGATQKEPAKPSSIDYDRVARRSQERFSGTSRRSSRFEAELRHWEVD